jgi:CheY-like chemotaxis protein
MNWKILLADDDAEDRTILGDAMSELSQDDVLRFAVNGEEALEIVEEAHNRGHQPCIIVLDLNMPRLNGSQTLAALKKDPRFSDIPVIIFSTSINPIEQEKCLLLGAQAYLVKPVSYRECLEMAKTFLGFCGSGVEA